MLNDIPKALHELANRLPSEASWADVRYEVELLASIERGLRQAELGQLITSDALRASLGLVE
jgi:predicted transcriptional regulator